MKCANCNAPLTAEEIHAGTCTFCGMAIAHAAPEPAIAEVEDVGRYRVLNESEAREVQATFDRWENWGSTMDNIIVYVAIVILIGMLGYWAYQKVLVSCARHGQDAEAVLLAKSETNCRGPSDTDCDYDIKLWVKPIRGSPFNAHVHVDNSKGYYASDWTKVGATIRVKFDPRSETVVLAP